MLFIEPPKRVVTPLAHATFVGGLKIFAQRLLLAADFCEIILTRRDREQSDE